MKMSIYLSFVLLLVLFLFLLISVLAKKTESQMQKLTLFECGFSNMSNSSIMFSSQFFFICVLFVVFDIEMVALISYPLEPTTSKNILLMTFFLLILALGLFWEWQKGKLDWLL